MYILVQFCVMEKIIIAQLSVQEKSIEQFLGIARIMVRKSNQEKGCLTYRLFTEVDKQNEFIFHEEYINEKAIEYHNSSEHFKIFVESVSDLLLSKPVVNMY